MTTATTDDLITYVADLVERLDRFAVTVLPPNERDEIELGVEDDGSLVVDLECRLPAEPRSESVVLDLFERWSPVGRDGFERSGYSFELRHGEFDYRRAFHRHGVDHFVRAFDVATHEHCESTMGVVVCRHYFGPPVADAFDAFDRLYDLWLTNVPPDCSALRCLG